MNLSSGVSLGQLIFSLITLVGVGGIAWGGLYQRVKTLEREVAAFKSFAELLTRIDERTKNIKEDVVAIKRSWLLMDPPPHDGLRRQSV